MHAIALNSLPSPECSLALVITNTLISAKCDDAPESPLSDARAMGKGASSGCLEEASGIGSNSLNYVSCT